MQKERKYLNYGYTTSSDQSYEDRQEALCLEVFKIANIQKGDVLVDVGFGSGEQDFLAARHYQFKKLMGFNIAGKQVQYANDRAKVENLSDKLSFYHSPAEDMASVQNESVDKIISIECAFHFNRSAFYKEAFRILKPGGLIVLADMCYPWPMGWMMYTRKYLRTFGTTGGNKRKWEKYFNTASIRSINKEVRPGCQMSVFEIYKAISKFDMKKEHIKSWKNMAFWTQITAWGLALRLLRYDLIVLQKPE